MGQLHRSAARRARYAVVAVLTAGLLPAVAPEAVAADHDPAPAHAVPRFAEVDLVSDVPGRAPLTDPDLVNGWGLTFGPTTPLWVNDNGTGVATLYAGGVGGAPVSKVLTVPIPGGAPTGQQFNDTTDFAVTGSGGTGPSRFIFVGENGDVSAWHPTLTPGPAVLEAHVDGAVYKGMTLWHTPLGNFLLAADFHGGRIDVFDHAFHRLSLPGGFFTDRHLPPGYAPFNVTAVGEAVYVTYARQDSTGVDEVDGRGLGFVDVYTDFGQHVRRLVSRGVLNAPWGLAIAPDSFGRFAGHLLVGNLGDGHVTVVDLRSGRVEGQLTGTDGHPLAIDGLWGLLPGTQTTGGTDAVWFSAGPQDEAHGLVGQIRPVG